MRSDLVEKLLHTPAETVERLLGIAHIEEAPQLTLPLTRKDLIDQRFEQQKLQGRGVLKLIKQDMLELRIDLEVEKLPAHALMQQPIGKVTQVIECQLSRDLGMGDQSIAVVRIDLEDMVQHDHLFCRCPTFEPLFQCRIDRLDLLIRNLSIPAVIPQPLFLKKFFDKKAFDIRCLKLPYTACRCICLLQCFYYGMSQHFTLRLLFGDRVRHLHRRRQQRINLVETLHQRKDLPEAFVFDIHRELHQ